MKKGLYLALISIVTVGCIIGGTAYHTYRAGERFFSFVGERFGDIDSEDSHIRGNLKVNSLNEILYDFSSVDIDVDVMSIKFRTGENYSISFDCTAGLEPAYEVKNGVLYITQKQKNHYYIGNTRCSLTITVPKNVTLSSLTVNQDVGDFDIRDVSSEITEISCDVGDIHVENGNMGKMDVSSDTGNIEIRNCEFVSLDADADVGNVEVSVTNSVADYRIDVKTDVGNTEVNGQRYRGGFHQEGSSNNYITISSDVGNVELEY